MEQQLRRIQEKIQQLLKRNQLLQKENEKLTQDNQALREQLNNQQELVDGLEQKLTAVKMSSGNLTEEERKELEKRMNAYIREIDRCITMLAE